MAIRELWRPAAWLAAIERTIGVTVGGLLTTALAVAGWFIANQLGGRALYLLAYCGVALVVLAIVLSRRRRPLHASRSTISKRARVGQVLDVNITLTTTSRVGGFRIEEQLHPRLGSNVAFPVTAVVPGSDAQFRYSLKPRVRGVFMVGPLTAEFTDPMGLARRHHELLPRTEIIVHPSVEGVLDRPLTRAFEDPPLRPPRARPWPQGFELYGMRDYVPGDDLRRVVWRAFGRTERLMVREFEQGISDRISILLDTDRSWHSASQPSDTFESAVSIAASVGVRHIKDGFTVRLFANHAQLGPAFRGNHARLRFLDELAAVQLGDDPLHRSLERLATARRRDDHVVVITTNFDSSSAARANLLVNEGASLTVCAVLWEESDETTLRRAREIGAQLVQVRPGASLQGVFRASLMTNARAGR